MNEDLEAFVPCFARALTPEMLTIDPRAFRLWCEAEDLLCNAEARLEYAQLISNLKAADASGSASASNVGAHRP